MNRTTDEYTTTRAQCRELRNLVVERPHFPRHYFDKLRPSNMPDMQQTNFSIIPYEKYAESFLIHKLSTLNRFCIKFYVATWNSTK